MKASLALRLGPLFDRAMEALSKLGAINGPIIGIVMKELVRRALERIRAERFIFEASPKLGRTGLQDDMVTSADRAAQAVYVKLLKECFPGFGIVAEEDALSVPCTIEGHDVFFSVDPLDGTKAFVRRQSHGIGTMLALVIDGEVVASCVGDVMTSELYYFRPDSSNVHRLSEFGKAESLNVDLGLRAAEQVILLRDESELHTPFTQRMVSRQGGAFRASTTASGSIGTGMARLWKSEVGAAILHPGQYSAWDLAPIVGISEKLGYIFLEVRADEGRFQEVEVSCRRTPFDFRHEMLVVHSGLKRELDDWANGQSGPSV